MESINLLNLDRSGMESLFVSMGHKSFHGKQVLQWIHQRGVIDFDQMTDLSKKLRAQLKAETKIELPRVVFEQPSLDGTRKWVLELDCGNRVETVLIPEGDRGTLCVSSQAGCALNCSFCSTAQQGFNRNLSTAEIIGQIWLARHQYQHHLTNIVMMGMGEPLANMAALIPALSIMQDDMAYGFSKYRVTVSTAGIVPALLKLGQLSDVSLAVSLHAANDELRNELVPINKKYPLVELLAACREYIKGDKRRKITWEYVMLDGINDSDRDAKQLIHLLEGTPSKINLIPFNPFPGTQYHCSTPERIEAFRQRLKKAGIISMTRKTRGNDINAACGQLVGQIKDRSKRNRQVAA